MESTKWRKNFPPGADFLEQVRTEAKKFPWYEERKMLTGNLLPNHLDGRFSKCKNDRAIIGNGQAKDLSGVITLQLTKVFDLNSLFPKDPKETKFWAINAIGSLRTLSGSIILLQKHDRWTSCKYLIRMSHLVTLNRTQSSSSRWVFVLLCEDWKTSLWAIIFQERWQRRFPFSKLRVIRERSEHTYVSLNLQRILISEV